MRSVDSHRATATVWRNAQALVSGRSNRKDMLAGSRRIRHCTINERAVSARGLLDGHTNTRHVPVEQAGPLLPAETAWKMPARRTFSNATERLHMSLTVSEAGHVRDSISQRTFQEHSPRRAGIHTSWRLLLISIVSEYYSFNTWIVNGIARNIL